MSLERSRLGLAAPRAASGPHHRGDPRHRQARPVVAQRGVPPDAPGQRRAGESGVALQAVVAANAKRFAADLVGVVADIRAAGHESLRAIAAELDARGMRTRRGGAWQVSSKRGLLESLDA